MTEEDQVRRLLAEARHTAPIPPDVADRMDGVLADLRADRPVPAAVGDLAAARRRRRVQTLLVAAAAVVVAGVGIGYARELRTGSGSDGASSGAADSSVAGSASRPEAAADEATDGQDFTGVPRLDPDRFGRQVARLRTSGSGGVDAPSLSSQVTGCAVPGPGKLLPVRYDGSRAVLVYRPARGDSVVVDLYLCGSDEPSRSITLPTR